MLTSSASRDLGAPATFDVREQTGITWDVVLHLLAPGDTPLAEAKLPRDRVLASSVLRLLIGRPAPGLLDAELVAMGSAGIKAMAVLADEVDAYVHAGGQYEWDSAAPVAVAQAAGLHTSRIDGSPLTYNQANPSLPDLVICRPEIAQEILPAIANLTTKEDIA